MGTRSLPGRLPDRWGTVLLEPPCQYSTCNDLSVTFLCSSLAHPLVCAAGTQRIVQPSQRRLPLQPDLSGAQREAPWVTAILQAADLSTFSVRTVASGARLTPLPRQGHCHPTALWGIKFMAPKPP